MSAGTLTRDAAPAATGPVVRVSDEEFARWDADRRQRAPRRSRAVVVDPQAIAAELEAHALRPIVDPLLRVVRADCPDCHDEATDELGLWRPLLVVPRPGAVSYCCEACGARVVRRV